MMKIKIVLVYFTLLMSLYSCNKKIDDRDEITVNDSIKKYLSLASNDTLAFEIRARYNDKAYSLIDLNKNDLVIRSHLNRITYNYLMTNKPKETEKLIRIYYQKSKVKKDTLGLARCYRYKGVYFKNNFLYDSAFYYYLKSEKLYLKTSNKIELGMIYFDKSIIQFFVDDYLGAELSAKKSYSYLKDSKSYFKIYSALLNLGNIYHNLKQYDKAIFTINKSLDIVKKHNLPDHPRNCLKGSCMNNIGNAYREQKKYNRAIYYFENALKQKDLFKKDPELFGYLQNNLGYCHFKTKNYKNLPLPFLKSDSIFRVLGIKNEQSISNLYLSEYYLLQKDTVKAIKYSEKAVKLAKEAKAPLYYLTALSFAGTINHKKASEYIRVYHHKNDSLIMAERNARNQYYKIQLETDEIMQQKNKAIRQKWNIAGLASLLILIGVLFFIINYLQTKQKRMLLLQDQQKANEQIYNLMLNQKEKEDEVREQEKKRIALELHDGIMNKLASTRMNLSVLSHKSDKETIDRCINYVHEIYKVEQEIRSVSHELHKEVLHKEDSFIKLLEDLIKEQKVNKTNYELELDSEINWNNISSKVKMNLYRIIQEACNNINKHAQANRATITFTIDEPNICLSITDDGIGLRNKRTPKGIGIQNMKLRVKSLKGKINFNSGNYSGTTINISVPLRKKN